MPLISLDIPAEALTALRQTPDEFVHEMRVAAAMHWYQRGVISQERAAEIAGLDRTDFLLALGREKVPAFAVDFGQLQEEISRG
jgi:predicted HTH domain antitoxin